MSGRKLLHAIRIENWAQSAIQLLEYKCKRKFQRQREALIERIQILRKRAHLNEMRRKSTTEIERID